ncbi:hypothetical protein ITJ86_00095 [Winogradskyella sp. F6397]|uniref:Uncharacterized protein n=1 Tax=Winogradskyella marina TaxID=2785530 RepID=A0ABS0ECV3_9FLAO|nr:hypothetical protein [Winogradskyella marina]MBF8148274.1 hypothetical protein [Winogradskyella marina]
MKKLLNYNQTEHHSFEENVIGHTIDILKKAQTELKNQGVETSFTLEQLSKGNFTEIFNSYHKKECKKQNSKFILSKYLDLCGFTDKVLQELEQTYKKLIDKPHTFYSVNNSFYKTCGYGGFNITAAHKEALKKAPKLKEYKVFDFLTIKGNNYDISVSDEFYKLYAVNSKQIDLINNIDTYITSCRNLGLEYKSTLEPIKKYIKDLERDLSKYELNFDNILIIQ